MHNVAEYKVYNNIYKGTIVYEFCRAFCQREYFFVVFVFFIMILLLPLPLPLLLILLILS
jgi:hypothetical protein